MTLATFLHQLSFHWQTFHLLPFYQLANTLLLKVTSLWFRCLPLSEAEFSKKRKFSTCHEVQHVFMSTVIWSTDISSTSFFSIGQHIISNTLLLKWNYYDSDVFATFESSTEQKRKFRVCLQQQSLCQLLFQQ